MAMMAVDHQTRWLEAFRSAVVTATAPVFVVTDLPYAATESLMGHVRLRQDNLNLHKQLLQLSVEAQRARALSEENARLRALLGSSARVEGELAFAEVVGVAPDPLGRSLILGKGDAQGVYQGQPVLDSDGLMGQVVEVGRYSSRVLLITDPMHITPVLVNRNDYRAMLYGTGDAALLELRHVPETADVQEGDLLVTSGLDGRFPPGYPVATVSSVRRLPGEPFLDIRARPAAQLERSRHLVLVTRSAPTDAAPPAFEADGAWLPEPDAIVEPDGSAP